MGEYNGRGRDTEQGDSSSLEFFCRYWKVSLLLIEYIDLNNDPFDHLSSLPSNLDRFETIKNATAYFPPNKRILTKLTYFHFLQARKHTNEL